MSSNIIKVRYIYPWAQWIRAALVDFGFATFLEKFEEKFGAIACKGLLFLIAVGVASVCISLLTTNLVAPIYNIILELFDDDQTIGFRRASNTIFTIAFFIWAVLYMVAAFRKKMELREVEKYKDDYQGYVEYVADFYTLHERHLEKTANISRLLVGRLTGTKRDEIAELVRQLEVDLMTAHAQVSEKVRTLNEKISPRSKADAQQPDMTGYDPDAVMRSPEDKNL